MLEMPPPSSSRPPGPCVLHCTRVLNECTSGWGHFRFEPRRVDRDALIEVNMLCTFLKGVLTKPGTRWTCCTWSNDSSGPSPLLSPNQGRDAGHALFAPTQAWGGPANWCRFNWSHRPGAVTLAMYAKMSSSTIFASRSHQPWVDSGCDKESFVPKGTCHFLLLPAKIKRIKDGSNQTNQLLNYKTTKLYPEMFTA